MKSGLAPFERNKMAKFFQKVGREVSCKWGISSGSLKGIVHLHKLVYCIIVRTDRGYIHIFRQNATEKCVREIDQTIISVNSANYTKRLFKIKMQQKQLFKSIISIFKSISREKRNSISNLKIDPPIILLLRIKS